MQKTGFVPQSGAQETTRQQRRAVIASLVGTTIEWYDFFIYGLAAATVFGPLYFPSDDTFAATLLSFTTFFLGFAARPLGALIFGHFGDRLGRKSTLMATLVLAGGSTVATGFLPTYASIGIWAPILLSVLRVLQGIGVGGEWGGAVAVATEWSNTGKRRGLLASGPQFGVPVGMLLAVSVLAMMSHFGPPEWFNSIGWRIPFIIGALLIFVGIYIRLGLIETPVFRNMQEKETIKQAPLVTVFRDHWKEVVLSCLIRTGQQAPYFLFTAFILTYGVTQLHLERSFLFNSVLGASALSLFTTPFFGYLSDRVGRKRLYIIGAVVMGLFAFPYFWMLDSGVTPLIVAAILISLPVHDMQYGPQAAFIAENFPPSVRYSGSSLGYQLAAIISGGPAPLIATYLAHDYGGSTAIAAYIVVTAAVSLVAAVLLRDRSKDDYEND